MRKVTLSGLLAHKLRLALTALAIVLGVTFVTGTLVLTDTLHGEFHALFGHVYQRFDFEIRGKAAGISGAGAGVDSTADRKPFPESVATAVRRLPGVAIADGSVGGYAQFVAPDGKAITGTSTLGFSFDPYKQLSPLQLVHGTAPVTADDVVMDKATAAKYHFAVGDRVRVLLAGPPRTFTITGIVTFGTADNIAGATLAAFYLPAAQQLFNSRGYYDTVNVLARPGTDQAQLQRAIARILPPGVEVVTGQTVASEQSGLINSNLSFLSTSLLVFALIALFVGGFTIFNTFSITVGQRTRELALLRVVGASRGQVFRSVLGEAALTGLAASLAGLGLGVLAAIGLEALLKGFGVTLPSGPLVFQARTVLVAFAVGVGVTVVSAIGPARRAVRIPAVAALADQREEGGQASRRRVIAGSILASAGVAALLAGLNMPAIQLVGIGALAVFISIGMLAPIAARPMARALGRPLAGLLGTAGRLGRENSMRSPRRTAQTAAALTVGLALVSSIAVYGASASTSASSAIHDAITADYVVTSAGSAGLSNSVAPALSRLPGVTAVSTVYSGQFDFQRSSATLKAISPANLPQTLSLTMTSGSGSPALAAGQLLIDSTTANAQHLSVGSVVPVKFAQTGASTMRIGGIFKPNALIGSYLAGAGFFLSHFNNPMPAAALVRTGGGDTGRVITGGLKAYPNLRIQTRAQFDKSQQSHVNQLLGLVYALLALAVIVALIGIVNTLMLSVFERTREIGLLRAVGMRRRQVRAMIRSEAVIIALFGAVVGVIIGTGLGIALVASLKQQGVTDIVIPIQRLAELVVLSALLGLGAASWPARRAARLDVLAAIAAR